jgi:hypothetical protein
VKKFAYLGLEPSDATSIRNCLFLAYGFEKVFDSLKMSFVKTNPLFLSLYVDFWDESYKSDPLWPGAVEKNGDYDGAVLNFGVHNLFKRCLLYQAYQAYVNCSIANKIPPRPHSVPTKSDGTRIESDFQTQCDVLSAQFYKDVQNEILNEEED